MERSGIRWVHEGAEAMLNVRCVFASSHWEEFQEQRMKTEQNQIHPHTGLASKAPTKLNGWTGYTPWNEFLKMHAAKLWQCDFYAKKVLTLKGFRDLYLLIFLHVDSRCVYISPSTFHPNEEWVTQ